LFPLDFDSDLTAIVTKGWRTLLDHDLFVSISLDPSPAALAAAVY
jgi:hypothetical protein